VGFTISEKTWGFTGVHQQNMWFLNPHHGT
jgi:hypothetical protein